MFSDYSVHALGFDASYSVTLASNVDLFAAEEPTEAPIDYIDSKCTVLEADPAAWTAVGSVQLMAAAEASLRLGQSYVTPSLP